MTSPTLAVIGEGGEPEYVIPESRMPRGGGITVGDIHVHGSNLNAERVGAIAGREITRRLRSSQSTRQAAAEAANGSLFS